MRIAAIIAGAVLVLVAARGSDGSNAQQFWTLLKSDFEPGQKGNFLAWFVAILIIGGIGAIPELKSVSALFLALVVVALLFSAIKQNPLLLQNAAASVSQRAS